MWSCTIARAPVALGSGWDNLSPCTSFYRGFPPRASPGRPESVCIRGHDCKRTIARALVTLGSEWDISRRALAVDAQPAQTIPENFACMTAWWRPHRSGAPGCHPVYLARNYRIVSVHQPESSGVCARARPARTTLPLGRVHWDVATARRTAGHTRGRRMPAGPADRQTWCRGHA